MARQKTAALIRPGSFVSIVIGETTHSLIFTTWIHSRSGPITRYAAISGGNKKMVWVHDPLTLPAAADFEKMTEEELKDFDQKAYFAVHNAN